MHATSKPKLTLSLSLCMGKIVITSLQIPNIHSSRTSDPCQASLEASSHKKLITVTGNRTHGEKWHLNVCFWDYGKLSSLPWISTGNCIRLQHVTGELLSVHGTLCNITTTYQLDNRNGSLPSALIINCNYYGTWRRLVIRCLNLLQANGLCN